MVNGRQTTEKICGQLTVVYRQTKNQNFTIIENGK